MDDFYGQVPSTPDNKKPGNHDNPHLSGLFLCDGIKSGSSHVAGSHRLYFLYRRPPHIAPLSRVVHTHQQIVNVTYDLVQHPNTPHPALELLLVEVPEVCDRGEYHTHVLVRV